MLRACYQQKSQISRGISQINQLLKFVPSYQVDQPLHRLCKKRRMSNETYRDCNCIRLLNREIFVLPDRAAFPKSLQMYQITIECEDHAVGSAKRCECWPRLLNLIDQNFVGTHHAINVEDLNIDQIVDHY